MKNEPISFAPKLTENAQRNGRSGDNSFPRCGSHLLNNLYCEACGYQSVIRYFSQWRGLNPASL